MHRLSFTASLVTASLAFGIALPAFADSGSLIPPITRFVPTANHIGTTDEVFTQLKAMGDTSNCQRQEASGVKNKCYADLIKHLSLLLGQYNDAEQAEIQQWDTDHANMGITKEFYTAQKTYHDALRAKHLDFNNAKAGLYKKFNNELKGIRGSAKGGGSSSGSKNDSSGIQQDAVKALQSTTCNQDRKDAQRVCLRLQLRMKHQTMMGKPVGN